MNNTIVLVDFSNLVHACWHPAEAAQKAGEEELARHREKCASCDVGELCTSRPRQYDARQVLLTNLDLKFQTLAEAIQVPTKQWLMVKDGHDTRKRELFPAYKAGRTELAEDIKPLAEQHIRSKKCRFVWSPAAEADDLIATITRQLVHADWAHDKVPFDVVIVSSDADLWALYEPPRVRVFLMTRKEWLTPAHIEKKFGFPDPRFIRLHKSLWGDASDAIPNAVPRMQKQLLPLIKASDGTWPDFHRLASTTGISERCAQLLRENIQQVEVNLKLVTLDPTVPVEWL